MTVERGKQIVLAWVPCRVVELLDALNAKTGVSRSEYLRQLIIQDLDRRSVFTTALKNEIFKQLEGAQA